jgi:hypothetical protein
LEVGERETTNPAAKKKAKEGLNKESGKAENAGKQDPEMGEADNKEDDEERLTLGRLIMIL